MRTPTAREAAVLNHAVPSAEQWVAHCFGPYVAQMAAKETKRCLCGIEAREKDARDGLAAVEAARKAEPTPTALRLAQLDAAEASASYALAQCAEERRRLPMLANAHGQACAEKALADKIKRWESDHTDLVTGQIIEGYDSAVARLGPAYKTRAQRDAEEEAAQNAKLAASMQARKAEDERERAALVAEIVAKVKADLAVT